jgi:hypothetical protein
MSFTRDPEVAEALAPFAAEAGSTPLPAGGVAAGRAVLEGIFRYADTAHPHPGDVTITGHELKTSPTRCASARPAYRSSSTSTPASRTSSTSSPSTPPPGASSPTASAPSPPYDTPPKAHLS